MTVALLVCLSRPAPSVGFHTNLSGKRTDIALIGLGFSQVSRPHRLGF
jgi:hypothetical protein